MNSKNDLVKEATTTPQDQALESQPEPQAPLDKPHSKRTLFIILAIVGALIVVSVIISLWWLTHFKKPAATSTANQTTAVSQPDSTSTLTNPQKIMAADGVHYFYYGAPVG